ncbi:MAG: hypothetical protein U1F36_01190 [Planctomycetota bacterium]
MAATPTPLFRRARAAWHRALGWACYRIGAFERARLHFERVLRCVDGDDFSAYVGLGRVAYKLGDYAGWRRECAHAQRTSPDRYARLRQPFDLFETQIRMGNGARSAASTVESEDPSQDASWSDSGDLLPRIGTCAPTGRSLDAAQATDRSRTRTDDCISEAERRHFRQLGPIPSEALLALDLDELARRLCG